MGRDDTPKDAQATERLMNYWADGPGAAKIGGWGHPGDFDACLVQLGKYVHNPEELKGLCAHLHHRATGAWPGHAVSETKKATASNEASVDDLLESLHDKIVDHYSPLIAQAMQDSVHGLDKAITAARKKVKQ